MKRHSSLTADDLFSGITVLYILSPVILFFWGWLKRYISIPLILLLLYFGYRLYLSLVDESKKLFSRENLKYWIITLFLIALWVLLSGIGGLTFQNSDFWVRNPIYRDLCEYTWPLIYNLSGQSKAVTALCGYENVAFSYYCAWWLPPAYLSKLLHGNEAVRMFLLYGWSLLGILSVIFHLNKKTGRCSLIIPIVMIFFSGMDILAYIPVHKVFPLTDHIEWWSVFFQYSSHTTQLFWVFNQSIPIWLILSILLNQKDNRYIAALLSLTFAYSPWATFTMVPLALIGTIRSGKKFTDVFNISNIFIPVVMLVVFGLFYTMAYRGSSQITFLFAEYGDRFPEVLITYLAFALLEFGILLILLGRQPWKDIYYPVVVLELLICPLFVSTDGNVVMRSSIPALFLLMYYTIDSLLISESKVIKKAVTAVLIIGAFTPMMEIDRSVYNTLTLPKEERLQEQIHSFGNIATEDEGFIKVARDQFFVYSYEQSGFFRYLAKSIYPSVK